MKFIPAFLGVLVLCGLGFVIYTLISEKKEVEVGEVLSFEDCVNAGYPIMESYPRQCKTPDGRTYAEELPPPPIVYTNASPDLIRVELPFPGAVTGKAFGVTGEARGYWFFEASFPVEVLDEEGNTLVSHYAEATDEWMTEDFVPFRAEIQVPETYMGRATLVLHRSNASGLPEHDASISFPFTIEY